MSDYEGEADEFNNNGSPLLTKSNNNNGGALDSDSKSQVLFTHKLLNIHVN